MTMQSRRAFLQTSLLGAAGHAIAAPTPDFTFVVLNDLHYRDDRCGEWFQRVTASLHALRPRPAFLVLAGDLSEDGTEAQLGAMNEIIRPFTIPVYPIIGNHDYTLEGDRSPYLHTATPALNYRFQHGGCQFLALDTTQGRSVYRTRISDETLAWLDAQLPSLSRHRPLILLTHFPLGRNWLRPRNAHAVLDRLRPYPLQAALSGHWHGLTEREEQGVHLSTGRCCSWWRNNHDGSPLKGYTICRVQSGAVTHEFRAVPPAAA